MSHVSGEVCDSSMPLVRSMQCRARQEVLAFRLIRVSLSSDLQHCYMSRVGHALFSQMSWRVNGQLSCSMLPFYSPTFIDETSVFACHSLVSVSSESLDSTNWV